MSKLPRYEYRVGVKVGPQGGQIIAVDVETDFKITKGSLLRLVPLVEKKVPGGASVLDIVSFSEYAQG